MTASELTPEQWKRRKELNKLRKSTGLNLYLCCGRRSENNLILSEELITHYRVLSPEVPAAQMYDILRTMNNVMASKEQFDALSRGPRTK